MEGLAAHLIGVATLIIFIVGIAWRGAWVISRQESRILAIEISQADLKKYIDEIHGMATELALLNQSMITLNREMKEVKLEIKGINTTLRVDKEQHLQCPHFPNKP